MPLGAVQVDVELTVGEVGAELVRDVHGERRLADAAVAAQRRRGRRGRPVAAGELLHEQAHLLLAAGEVGDVGRQHARRPGPGRPRAGGPARSGGTSAARQAGGHGAAHGPLVPQDGALQVPQLRPRLDAQLVHEQAAGLAVDLQGLGTPPAPVQRQHLLTAQALPERMLGGEPFQPRQHVGRPAQLKVGVDAELQGGEPAPFQPGPLHLDHRGRGNVGQRA